MEQVPLDTVYSLPAFPDFSFGCHKHRWACTIRYVVPRMGSDRNFSALRRADEVDLCAAGLAESHFPSLLSALRQIAMAVITAAAMVV